MPELPEVETCRRGLVQHLVGKTIKHVTIRQPKLRWPVPTSLSTQIKNQEILDLSRRAKYLILKTQSGNLLIHLGMSGRLCIKAKTAAVQKHDHIDFELSNGTLLRYTDPRRFGSVLWTTDATTHPLLAKLGPEPLSDDFTADYLYAACRSRNTSIKQLIMDQHIVVGVGNIYASEALFATGIRPKKAAKNVAKRCMEPLVANIKTVLSRAIEQGGTTLKDFVNGEGKPGYFQQQLAVYGRENEPCLDCQSNIKRIILGQRSTFYCPTCQL